MGAGEVFSHLSAIIGEAAKSPLGVISLAILVVAVVAVYLSSHFKHPFAALGALALVIAATGGFLIAGFSAAAPKKVAELNGRGFWRDTLNNAPDYMASETLRLIVQDNDLVTGRSESHDMLTADQHQPFTGEYALVGYRSGDNLILSYRTRRLSLDGTLVSGIGGYVLRQRGPYYAGWISFWSSGKEKLIRCPYVLAPPHVRASRLSDFAALSEPCVEIAFPEAVLPSSPSPPSP